MQPIPALDKRRRVQRFWKLPHARIAFLNYRHADEIGVASGINEHLRNAFPGQVWFDRDDEAGIPLGEDWERDLVRKARVCRVLVALIGKRWAGEHATGRRIDLESDWVRREIEMAIAAGAKVIPVLLEGAELPDHLPGSLQVLRTMQHPPTVRIESLRADCANLAKAIRPFLFSGWYLANLAVAALGSSYLAAWLWAATERWTIALILAAVVPLFALTMYFSRKLESTQTVRACLSRRRAMFPALVPALIALTFAASTPVLRVDSGGQPFRIIDANARVHSGAVTPFWFHRCPVSGLRLETGDLPPQCLTASILAWPFSDQRFHFSTDRTWSAAALVPTPPLCGLVSLCRTKTCEVSDPNALRMSLRLLDSNGDVIDEAGEFQYRGQIIWIGAPPPKSDARISNLQPCALPGARTPLVRFASLACGLVKPAAVEYRWIIAPDAWSSLQRDLDPNPIRLRIGPSPANCVGPDCGPAVPLIPRRHP